MRIPSSAPSRRFSWRPLAFSFLLCLLAVPFANGWTR